MPSPSINFSAGTVVTSTWLNAVDASLFDFVVNVREWGATGDGTTDDRTVIQAAIDFVAGRGGGTVFFPKGTYIIGDASVNSSGAAAGRCDLEITSSNMTFRGERGAILKAKGGVVTSLEMSSLLFAFQKTDITIESLVIDGNKANNDINDNYGNGINIWDCKRVSIINNHIYNCARDGITITDQTRLSPAALGNEDIMIANNLVTGCRATSQTTGGEGIIVVQGDRIIIENNISQGNWRGIELETLATTADYRGCVNITVTGNICNNNEYGGIGINGPSRVNLTGNVCDGNDLYGIRINSSIPVTTSEITLTGNRVTGPSTTGVSIENYQELTLASNSIQNCTKNLYLTDVVNIVINGNVIAGATQHGVDFLIGTNNTLLFTGNMIRASNQSAGAFDNVAGNANYAIFSANRIEGTSARYGINAAGSSWTIIGNSLDNSGTTGIINDTTSGGARIRDNGGFITEQAGAVTINSGSTSVVVSHGCSKTPNLSSITVTLGENPTATAGDIWVSTITSTQFTINCRNNPGVSNLDIGWKVQII